MKIAIVYTTVGGTTRECAELLAKQLERHDVTVADMSENIDVASFDLVVVGFPVRMGKTAKSARRFFKENEDALAKMQAGYFMCCGFVDCFDEYKEKVIPERLREGAFEISCFGGSLEPSRFRGFDKIVIRAVRSEILGGGENGDMRADMSLPTIMDENIAQFADSIKRLGESHRW
jgi:menaquinone-dependent protoporphyrinogen IX oxidase